MTFLKGLDTDRDGLGDTSLPYNANGNIQNGGDSAPLVPVSVGSIPELPKVSDSSNPLSPALAGAAIPALLPLTAGAWYARRRWLR
jgi:hypothetical protein